MSNRLKRNHREDDVFARAEERLLWNRLKRKHHEDARVEVDRRPWSKRPRLRTMEDVMVRLLIHGKDEFDLIDAEDASEACNVSSYTSQLCTVLTVLAAMAHHDSRRETCGFPHAVPPAPGPRSPYRSHTPVNASCRHIPTIHYRFLRFHGEPSRLL